MSLHHVIQQLNERQIPLTLDQCLEYSGRFEEPTAIILGEKIWWLDDYQRLILIIRDGQPVTIMFRRMCQSLNCGCLNVKQIIREIIL